MADRLYLNIWFPSFHEEEILPRLLSVLKQFPFSAERAGVGFMAVRSISWEEPIIFQQTFDDRVPPETAIGRYADSDGPLHVQRRFDGGILRFLQSTWPDLAARMLGARLDKSRRRKQTADMIGAIGVIVRHMRAPLSNAG